MTDFSYLSRIQRPSRYSGGEINAVLKDPRAVALRVALLFPDLYEVGMSHLGLGLLYDILNRREDIWAERAYTPAPDLEAELRSRGLPLASLESGSPLRDFDLVGISLQYELSYTNLLNMLDLGGIPLLAQDRGPGDPVVIGGGPAGCNPEPVAPFFDALVLGDGEEVILELADALKAWKRAKGSRRELWQALEAIDGIYIPAFFEPVFDASGHLLEVIPRGSRSLVHKRLLSDLNRVAISPRPVVPYCQIVHDRLQLEIARGCSRGCRYCQAGMLYRPVRERDPAKVVAWVEEALEATGYEDVSLLSLSAGDYGPLSWLLTRLMDRLAPRKVALSLPSLRADTLTPEIMGQIKRVRRTGLTLAPEAGSERLRRVINKNLAEETITDSAARAFKEGWQLLKLYFMIGLPQETPEDLEAIAQLTRQILKTAPKGRRGKINLSLSTFIPKAHTPFQWEPMADLEESRRRLHAVKDRLRQPQVQAKWNSAAQSWLEGVFSRGDRRLAKALLAAHRRGCRLDAWSEHLRLEPWKEAFREAGIDPDFYLRERKMNEVLPWDHLDSGVSREFLVQERERAYQEIETPDCHRGDCQDCGVCGAGAAALDLQDVPAEVPSPPRGLRGRSPQAVWYRLHFSKVDAARWLSHLELVSAFYRSLRRSRLPLSFSDGFHPLPRVSFHGALPVGVESLAETLDVELAAPLANGKLVADLNLALPPGLKILQAQRLPKRLPPPRPQTALYGVQSPEPWFDTLAASDFLSREEVLVTRSRPKEERTINLRQQVGGLEVLDPHNLRLTMHLQERDNLKVTDALAHIFHLNENQARDLQILKLKSI